MTTTQSINEFMLGQSRAFVIPGEVLSSKGISDAFQSAMQGERGISTEWIELFNEAFALYWERTADLARRAPRFWLPPRVQNVLIAGPDEPALPFAQPFYRASWTMYASDFDPEHSDVEFATYLFLHQERMAQTQQILAAFVQNLPYWLDRMMQEVRDFQAAAKRATRPDAAAFCELADALPMVRTLHDSVLRPPTKKTRGPLMEVPPTSLLATQPELASLQSLGSNIGRAVEGTMAAFAARYRSTTTDGFEALRAWLEEARPDVIVTAKPNEILWSPDGNADAIAFREVAGRISPEVSESIRADLGVIGECTRRFLDSLREPEALPPVHEDMEQQGLSYLHIERNLVAYSLTDPVGNRLGAPTPTYDRLMLAARTIHEWGHQAVDAGWVPVPEEKADTFASLNSDLVRLFDEIVSNAPAEIMAVARADLGALSRASGEVGRALSAYAQSRMPDFQANLLSQHYLARPEAEAYVRNNVYCLNGVYPPAQLFRQLARYAYEYQYLRFSDMDDRDGYFRGSTWFDRQFIDAGVVSGEQARALFELLGAICDCYCVDEAAFRF